MKNFRSLFLLALSFSVLTACMNPTVEEQPTEKQNNPSGQNADEGSEYEEYIASIDNNDSLNLGNSLYYTKDSGGTYEVKVVLNDSSEIVKMTEFYTEGGTASIQSNVYYYRDGGLYSTKEYFEEGFGEEAYFVERVSYYDSEGEPLVTKRRTAPFEDLLDQETFTLVEKYACSEERPTRALRQEGEFKTLFKGIIEDNGVKYLIVGEEDDNGYYSALLIQYYTPYAQLLMQNENQMKGTHLVVNFEAQRDASGYNYQSLIFVGEAE